MFTSEKALVDKLVMDLQEKYDTQYIVRELRGGNNIADIVYTTDLNRDNVLFDEYFNAYYYFNGIYNKKNIAMKEIEISNSTIDKKFHNFLHDLEEMGYIKITGNHITSLKKIDVVTKNFIAIEAKLSDWKSGLEQAVRYKQYANEVYIAISSEYINKVDRDLLMHLNVGLMSVSQGKLRIPIKAKKEKVKKLDIQYYMADRFLRQLQSAET
jgi:superfamily II helicase